MLGLLLAEFSIVSPGAMGWFAALFFLTGIIAFVLYIVSFLFGGSWRRGPVQ